MKRDTNYRREQIKLLIDNRINQLEKKLLEETLKGVEHRIEFNIT